jgi:hypothetical protein
VTLEECLEEADTVLESMERIKAWLRVERPQVYERWKAGDFIVDADVINMYLSLHDISQQLMDERDANQEED